MEEKQVRDLARQIAQRLLVRQAGDMDDPETWTRIAVSFGCRLSSYHQPGGALGDYVPSCEGGGVITYNDAVTPPAQARIIVHELAHHLLMPLVPGFLFGDYVHCLYEDDPDDVRHRIARRVEELCFRRS